MARLPAPSGPKKLRMAHPPFPGGSREFSFTDLWPITAANRMGGEVTKCRLGVPCNLILHLVMHSKDKDSFDEAESQSSWDKNAALYAEKFLDPALYKTGYDALFVAFTKRGVLDAACGPGIMAHYF